MKMANVAILLCLHNSERFLREQMASFFSQEYADWELWVSNDGSTDGSLDIVREFANRGKKITVVDGPCRGATANFLSVAQKADCDAEYFAWADADDIWLPDKLTRAVRRLDTMQRERATLYCGRTIIVDRDDNPLYLSTLYAKPPCFRNALSQNIAGGNTMVFNRTLRDLLCVDGLPDILFHDWWAYILATGCGGEVYYDSDPCLRYRQHEENLIGCNRGLRAQLYRGRQLFHGAAREWNRTHIKALREYDGLLTAENREVLALFAKAAEASSPYRRLEYFLRSGVRRQSLLHNLSLGLATMLGRYP